MGILFILIGVIAALVGAVLWSGARKQRDWETVQGTVCAGKVSWGWGDGFYHAEIEYAYSYRGRAYRGWTVRSPQGLVNWRGPSQRAVDKYPPGSAVTVFVNPENPWDTVLEPGGDPKFVVFIVFFSLFWLLFGLGCLRAAGKV
jgi:hypothetical protein